jgi:abortive infection bacteriophage resistance protein
VLPLYNKPPKSVEEQIALLESRGLVFEDKMKANHFLSNISYYRLSAYMRYYQAHNDPNHKFIVGTTFSKILRLYVFDRKLRTLVFDIIEKVEISFRTKLILNLSFTRGPSWFQDQSLFKDIQKFNKTKRKIIDEVGRSKERFVIDYKNKYSAPLPPPAWITFEVISLGQLSTLYSNLKDIKEKNEVADSYNLSKTLVSSWIHSITYLRNICGHHNRLWNRKFTLKPSTPRKKINYWPSHKIDMTRLYGVLVCLQYINKHASPNTNFPGRLKVLLQEYNDTVTPSIMGFPPDWEKDAFWM